MGGRQRRPCGVPRPSWGPGSTGPRLLAGHPFSTPVSHSDVPRQRPRHPPRGTGASAVTWGAAKVHLPLLLANMTHLRHNLIFRRKGLFLLAVEGNPSHHTKCFGLGGIGLVQKSNKKFLQNENQTRAGGLDSLFCFVFLIIFI